MMVQRGMRGALVRRVSPVFALVGILAVLTPPAARAQNVVPNALAAVEGANGLSTPVRSLPRTIQLVIGASELSGLTGQTLTALAFRLDVGQAAQPLLPLTFSSYDIYIGAAAVAPSSISNTLLSNYASPASKIQVRNGSLTMNPGFFPSTNPAGPNAFAQDIAFNLAGYTYSGGNLVVEITHTGNGAGDFAVDATPGTAGVSAVAAAGYNATTADGTNSAPGNPAVFLVPVLRFTSSSAPEPGALLFVVLGAGVLVGRRRTA